MRCHFAVVTCGALWLSWGASAADVPAISFNSAPGRVDILAGDQPLATYFFQDETITRPYFAHVHAPGGVQLTRRHPPDPKQDATDHAEMHPGIWLAFGDLSGADDWRNKARVRHEEFANPPESGPGKGTFAVVNHYLSGDGKSVLCRETCRYTILVRDQGYLILWDSKFRCEDADFNFGDQEEMGLGVRVATPLTVQKSGEIITSDGHRNEAQVRGKQSAWCDYRGTISDLRAGICLMPHPKNFRPCWFHARDYGLLAANPFGRQALTGGEPSSVVVKKGETLRLRFGLWLHAAPRDDRIDAAAAYREYLELSAAD